MTTAERQLKKRNLTEGPIFFRLILFTLPIMASGVLQVLYNMADNIVVGSFSGDDLALAAVGSTSTLTTLIVRLLLGFATGSGVVIAQLYGARDTRRLGLAIHTAITFALIGGIILASLGAIGARWMLTLIGTKEELLSRAVLYFKIICIGIPAATLYNFGSSILRSLGNSKTPLLILSLSGIINVILNLIFVIFFKMSVAGVALATIISQYFSAIWVLIIMMRQREDGTRLTVRGLGIERKTLGRIVLYGLPTGLQSASFSIANIFITSAVNTRPTTTVAANTIANNIDSIVHTVNESFMHSAMAFVGQNYGARKPDRIKKIILICLSQVILVGIAVSQLILLFSNEIAFLFVSATDPNREVILDTTLEIMKFILPIYFICGIMNLLSGIHRGLGNSIAPMVIGISGVLGVRLVWVLFFFPTERFHSITGLYIAWPLTWFFCITLMSIAMIFTWRRMKRKFIEIGEEI